MSGKPSSDTLELDRWLASFHVAGEPGRTSGPTREGEPRVLARRYELQHEIARGGMSVVCQAYDQVLERIVAVKFLATGYLSQPECRLRFEQEARASARLRTRHIAQIHDHGITEGVPWIVMERLYGEDLHQRMQRDPRLPFTFLVKVVDEVCRDDPHLAASRFVDHDEASRYFRRHGGREGVQFHAPEAAHRRGRFRVTEAAQAAMGCKPYSNFNLVGAAQVGKSSLTGMRVLHRLGGRLPVWPFDPLPRKGSAVLEIYAAIAALAGGRTPGRSKMRSHAELDEALRRIGSSPIGGSGGIDDHSADALLTSAWLRSVAEREALWRPRALNRKIALTEGWTFGAP